MNNKRKLPNWLLKLSFVYSENKKGILLLLSIFIFFSLLFTPFYKVKTFFYDYNCETKCSSWNITANKGISHSLEGSSIETHSYTVNYSYDVDGLSYEETIVLNIGYGNTKLLNALLEKRNALIIVKYNCKNPYKSVVAIVSE